jgi:integrase/recombinase XerD
MNRNSSCSLTLNKAVTGFLNFKIAEGLAQLTFYSYERILVKWVEYMGECKMTEITSQDLSGYLSWLRTEYTPERMKGKTHPLSPKSIRNVWITLSSFFNWASQEFKLANPMKDITPPRIKKTPVEPFTQDEVERMLMAYVYAREVRPRKRRSFTMRMRFSHRDQAIILTPIETSLRAMELCKLLIGSIDLKTGRVDVKHGMIGGVKGGKGRTMYLGKETRKAVCRYLVDRKDANDPDAPVYLDQYGRHFNPGLLRQLIKDIADRAGVKDAYPHKFRHTLAITYLCSGGDIYTLQSLLGHSSQELVRNYAQIA